MQRSGRFLPGLRNICADDWVWICLGLLHNGHLGRKSTSITGVYRRTTRDKKGGGAPAGVGSYANSDATRW